MDTAHLGYGEVSVGCAAAGCHSPTLCACALDHRSPPGGSGPCPPVRDGGLPRRAVPCACVSTQIALASAATLISLGFTATVLERWLDRHRPQDMAWAVALLLFSLGAGSMWLGASVGWSAGPFRAFYIFGAVLNVPILALGTIYLMMPRPRADRITLVTVVACAFGAGIVLMAPTTGTFIADELPQGSEVFGAGPRIAAALASSLGALVVVGGSVWSATRLFRTGGASAVRGGTGNVLIALGAVTLSLGGLLNSVVDEMTGFSISMVIGIALIFAGALTATSTGNVPADS